MARTVKDLNKVTAVADENGVPVNRSVYELETTFTPNTVKVETNKWLLQQRIADLIDKRDDIEAEIIELTDLTTTMKD